MLLLQATEHLVDKEMISKSGYFKKNGEKINNNCRQWRSVRYLLCFAHSIVVKKEWRISGVG